MSEIQDEILADFPDFVVKQIRKDKLVIDIPGLTQLVGSRNAMHEKEAYIEAFRPHIYALVLGYIARKFLDGKMEIKTLPDDYF